MKRIAIALIAVLAINLGFAQEKGKLIDKIVGIVGENIIMRSDIEKQYQQQKGRQQQMGMVDATSKCKILRQMLAKKMFLRQAELDSVVIKDKQVETELNRRVRYFANMIGSKEKLEEYYGKSIEELKNDFREDIRNRMRSQRVRRQVLSDVTVSPSEVRNYYNSMPEDSLPYYDAEVELGQIVVKPKVTPKQKQKVKERLRNMRKRVVEEGQDFSTLAIMYSDDEETAQDGGDLGYISKGEMVSKFENAAFELDSGEVSDVVNTKYGYHLIQSLGQKGEQVHVRHILLKPKAGGGQYESARNRLDSIRQLLVNGKVNFKKAVNKFSDHERSKNQGGMIVNQRGGTRFTMDELDPDLYFVIDTMQVGDYSQPMSFQTEQGEQAFRIVYLKNQTEPHQADLQRDYTKLKNTALQEKKQEEMKEWFQRKIDKTYIFVSPDYHNCEELDIWVTNQNATSRNSYE